MSHFVTILSHFDFYLGSMASQFVLICFLIIMSSSNIIGNVLFFLVPSFFFSSVLSVLLYVSFCLIVCFSVCIFFCFCISVSLAVLLTVRLVFPILLLFFQIDTTIFFVKIFHKMYLYKKVILIINIEILIYQLLVILPNS